MTVTKAKPTSPGRRHRSDITNDEVTKSKPEKSLLKFRIKKSGGRGNTGRVTVRHRGGGAKRHLRAIDWKRNKFDIPGKIIAIEYDPNRSSHIALVHYPDGDKRYILAPVGLKPGDAIISGKKVSIKLGNALPLKNIPVGTPIHNLELTPGKGGQIVRGAGTQALIQSKEKGFATVLLPSKEIRLIKLSSLATIGQVGRSEHRIVKIGKAGRKRHMGWRPAVRGVAMHPGAHPHGGGEGRSGIGMPSPKSPWGKRTLGKKTRKVKKYSDKFIIRDRRKK